jgi:hypothetical protein
VRRFWLGLEGCCEVDNEQSNLQPVVRDLNWVKRIALLDAESAEILAGIGGIL